MNNYTYSANGKKLKVEMKFGNQTKTMDYVGNMIYENRALKRILVDGGYVENTSITFIYRIIKIITVLWQKLTGR